MKGKNPKVIAVRQQNHLIRKELAEPHELPPPPRHGNVGPRKKPFVDPHHRS